MKQGAESAFLKDNGFSMKQGIIFTILCLLFSGILSAQDIPVGTWRSHLNYSDSRLLVYYNQKIFVAAANGLFYYDPSDNSINKLTKADGFGDVGISAMAVSPDGKKLIIGYSSGHLDILTNNALQGINDIRLISDLDDKSINDIIFYNGVAYLCTGFGLAALDYEQGLVRETYGNIGNDGQRVAGVSGTIIGDSLFLATPAGILGTSVAPSNNLMDFNNWYSLNSTLDYPNAAVDLVAGFNEKLYASFADSGLFVYHENTWEEIFIPQEGRLKNLTVSSGSLYTIGNDSSGGNIFQINKENEVIQLAADYISNPSDLIIIEDGDMWIADRKLGLVSEKSGREMGIYPPGPASDNISRLTYYEKSIAGIERGIDEDFSKRDIPGSISIFQDGEWLNYNAASTPYLSGLTDFTDLTYHAGTANLLIGTFGGGLIGYNVNSKEFSRPFGASSSALTTGNISALAEASDELIWLSEYSSPDKLWALSEEQEIDFTITGAAHIKEIKIAPDQSVWLRLEKGMVVLDPETGNTQHLTAGSRNLIQETVTAFDFDKYGYLWYGTSSGIAWLNDQGNVFEGGANSIIPEYQNDDLLKYQKVDALGIDAANRKWIATAEGLWLFSEDGDSLIHHFTEENSPLLSNSILDIEINRTTGELFIATSKGLVSYRSNASEGKPNHQQVKIFPNPVLPGFSGTIAITGLVDGANVKITDVSGNLVREINGLGGTASWDGNTLSGRRAASGVYLVFSASQDGEETYIGKIAFLH